MSNEATAPEAEDAEPAEVLDPEQYNQNRRLKSIHQARDNVRDALEDATAGKAPLAEHTRTHRHLARTVAMYGHELLPLMDEADYSHELPEGMPADTIRDYIQMMGQFRHERDSQPHPPIQEPMHVFARLNQFAADVGLGADLDEGTDEWEV